MNVVKRHRIMALEDFLAWEARQELRYEFDGFEPVAMAGGSRNHARIQANLAIAIGGRLRGTPCEFLGSDLKLVTGSRVRYPNGQVVCTPGDGAASFTTAPVVLFEVLSPGSVAIDTVDKVDEYRQIPSVRRYVILDQLQAAATIHERRDGSWFIDRVGAGTLAMPEIGIELPLSELYEGVSIP